MIQLRSISIIWIVHNILLSVRCLEIPLDNGWFLENSNKSIQIQDQRIPTGVYTALEIAGITDSLLNSFNDVDHRWIAHEEWTYSLSFDVSDALFNHSSVLLVCHGLDTTAKVTLNGEELLPKPSNMFVRYRYDVKNKLIMANNVLAIHFDSPIQAAQAIASKNNFTPPECPPSRYHGECHMNFLRKMQASFAWDWGLAAPSVSIWKPVVIEAYDTAIIRDVTYRLHPTIHDWEVYITVHLESGVDSTVPRSFEGYLTLKLENFTDTNPIQKFVRIKDSTENHFEEVIAFRVPKSLVQLWWPNGYGAQKLYTLNASWQGENRDIFTNEIRQIPAEFLQSEKVIRIGFRTIDLIEDAAKYGNSFYFKVNGAPIFMKGTNWIPIDVRSDRLFDTGRIQHLLRAVKDAHMNVVRVWGGGVYESDYFYNLADEYGILIWQDMMFACAMYPVFPEFKASVHTEIEQNIRRIQHHPSILLWAGNNENEAALIQNWYGTSKEKERFMNEYVELYRDTVETAVKDNDQWHIWLYSSPSNGNKNTEILNSNPQDNHNGDVHHYDYFSDGWNSNIYPKARFISEYGFQSLPSLHSIIGSMDVADNIHDIIEHRQHFPLGNAPMIGLIKRHFRLPSESNSLNYWDAFIYFSQISQAMSTKVETETYRIGRYFDWNTMGALYWQLNDVWTAPSWSGIEHNGNFKILHYWAKEFFAPVHVIANVDVLGKLNIFVVRDTLGADQSLELHMKIVQWSSLQSAFDQYWNISVPENTVILAHQQNLNDYMTKPIEKSNSFLYFELNDRTNNEIVSTNFLLLEPFKYSKNIVDPNLKYAISDKQCDRKTNIQTAKINIRVAAPAIFVYIKIMNPSIVQYRLSKNGFIQLKSQDTVSIAFYNRNCAMAFSYDDIQISTVNQFVAE